MNSHHYRPHPVLLAVLAASLLAGITGCSATMTREELLARLQRDEPILIVDVRSEGEYRRDHIPEAVRIPFYAIGTGMEGLGFSKGSPVVLYCEHGPRAGLAGISLFMRGYDAVYSLEGHMKGWRENEFPLEKSVPLP